MKGISKIPPANDLPFAGKVALVTGAASGIGRATALAFGRAGAHVVVADTAVDGGHATAAMIVESGGKALFVRSDIARAGEVEALVEKAINYYGRLDIAVNNAGVDEESAPVADGDEEQFDRIMAANVKGVWLCMKYQLRQMLKQGSGTIVNVSSVSGLVGAPGRAVYAASKHAVVGLTRSAAAEYARDGIRINVLCPGGVKTPMLARFAERDPSAEKKLRAAHPMGRFAEAGEVAQAALWLASDGASYVNGHEMVVDGGFTAV
ncbi:SDR family oxidoreductase [Massilia yuzhufengensis]|uniref:NAD(P)-dependent dehydrogenase, short-chain alcohol dehydrogenase family n=1 Tax=Massilia yuzhufengensis TaxID=1164594 RepID=A0A1I1TCJ2_9BURK|nr:SDR family oxidoreductase [Massilia yuzhufengensis]SFD56357.1 NAD(P)-dependent dehydrogenase, short-chain alcohol dehydrogenase family [Massilia yuzhufengensis]